jgi:hypothetical protein
MYSACLAIHYTQADMVFILQATRAPDFLPSECNRLPEPAHTNIGSTGLDDN